jgi:hypothetical protein
LLMQNPGVLVSKTTIKNYQQQLFTFTANELPLPRST